MEQQPYNRRPPRPKLKMPLFGNMMGGGENNAPRRSERLGSSKWTPWIFLMALVVLGIDLYRDKTSARRTFTGATDILGMEWNGKVVKKYANVVTPEKIHYLIELKNSKGEKQKLDLMGETTNLWDYVSPNNTIVKSSGSLSVTVKSYSKKDTVLVMSFAK
ncbi:hypothetical protein SAMN04515674_12346 [Pseudarcicella hirudinis]|uniref:Uncharacterized protein n=1 Tax=Pseudarcicella hirudinis TaxID=1079859 RepID=A0A1I5Z1D1_9BACT|nr:hypothetical protein [Pseudarcicella hirudinis]SFQ50261.1 hypothetical protein SAMN04515674_12346 [Pseudarcicella hirudinis]